MTTLIRPEVSTKNKYWIDKHRHYELKHFCLQYPSWRKAYIDIGDSRVPIFSIERIPTTNIPSDPTARKAIMKAYYLERMRLVESVAMETDKDLYAYILKGVTEGLSYTYLKTKLDMPCGKDMYYDRYRRFFWLLSHSRE